MTVLKSLTQGCLMALMLLALANDVTSASANHGLFSRFGLARWEGPDKPQLSTSRRIGESSVYYIKLPPSPYYYVPFQQDLSAASPNMHKLPMNFMTNGKPDSIYHWNIPVLRKMAKQAEERKKHVSSSYRPKISAISDSKIFNIVKAPAKTPSKAGSSVAFQPRTQNTKPIKMAPYSFNQLFSGNGKPQSMYVIQDPNKSVFYHRFLP